MPEGGDRSQIWKGSLSFGLVSVPVTMVASTRDLGFRFRQLHATDLAPIEQHRYCSAEQVEVEWDEIGRGYETDDGELVILTDEELDAVAPERTQTVEIEAFTDLAQIDPIQFDRSYYLVPTGKSEGDRRAYKLLADAMEQENRAAIGRFVMRSRQYLVAVRSRDGVLALTTLHFHDEIRSAAEVPTGDAAAPKRQVKEAVAVLEELSGEWNPEEFRDFHRERLAKVIKDKRKHRTVRPPEPVAAEPTAEAPDLMAALKRTLQEAQGEKPSRGGARKRKGPAKNGRAGSATAGKGSGSLDQLSRDQLYRRAQEAKLPGRSKMSKDELRKALREK